MDLQVALDHRAQVEQFRRKYRTGLVTLLFTDIVGSTKLKQALGDREAVAVMHHHHALVRETLGQFPDGQEISTAGDSFFLVFFKPSDGVRFALLLQARLRGLNQGSSHPVMDRIGIHIGEVVIEEREGAAKPRDLYGMQVDSCARVMSLAAGNQILLTRSVFDNARQALKGEEMAGLGALSWLNHGTYQLAGVEEPVEICEVGEANLAALKQPPDSEKARRAVVGDQETVLGWRPAAGQLVPNTKWVLEQKLGEGGFGEVWLGRHQTMKERRVFKFCFRADRVRSLKREMTLFRILKERVGDHPNIVRLLEVCFDEPPFYVVMDHVEGQDLKAWCEEQGGVEKVPLAARLEIVSQIADALQAAHDAGVIHRDVKPGNILVHRSSRGNEALPSSIANRQSKTENQSEPPHQPSSDYGQASVGSYDVEVKLTDFGIGQIVSAEALAGVTNAGFTQTIVAESSSSQAGSQMYTAPELLAGKSASTRSDIYSLGVVLYQLLVGDLTRPLTTDWADHIADPLLRDDLKHCFAGNPQDRFSGADQLANSLRALSQRQRDLVEQQAKQAAKERAAYRRGVVRTVAVAFLIVAVIGFLAADALNQSHMAQQRLYDSLVREARATRMARRAGYRDEVFKLIQQARALDVPNKDLSELRQEAAACLGDFVGLPPMTFADFPTNTTVLRSRFEPASQRGAFVLSDGTVSIRQMPSGEEVARWKCRKPPRALCWSATGDQLLLVRFGVMQSLPDQMAGAAFDVWSRTAEGRWFQAEEVLLPGAFDCLSSAQGLFVAVGDLVDSSIKLFDIKTKKVVHGIVHPATMPTFHAPATTLSPSGQLLVAGTVQAHEPTITVLDIWDLRTGRRLHRLEPRLAWIHRVIFSPDGKYFVCLSGSGGVIYGTDGFLRLAELNEPFDEESWVSFLPDRTVVGLPLLQQPGVCLWDWQRNETLAVFDGSETSRDAVFATDGSYLLTSGASQARLYRLSLPKERISLHGHTGSVPGIVFSPEGTRLVSVGKDRTLRMWDALTGRVIWEAGELPGQGQSVAFSPDGRFLATTDFDTDLVGMWDARAGKRLLQLGTNHPALTMAVQFSPDGQYLASAGARFGPGIRVWKMKSDISGETEAGLAPEPVARLDGRYRNLTFMPDGRRLVFQQHPEGWPGTWDFTGTNASRFFMRESLSPGYSISMSHDGRRLFVMDARRSVVTFDAATGDKLSSFPTVAQKTPPSGASASLSLSPSGAVLAATSASNLGVDLWHPGTGRLLYSLPEQNGAIGFLAWSPDSHRLAISRANGEIAIWNLPEIERVLAELALKR